MKRVGIIAGATGGIGRSLSRELAKQGDDLALFGKDKLQLEEVKNEIQGMAKNLS